MDDDDLPRPSVTAVIELYGSRVFDQGNGWRRCTCPLPAHEDKNPSASVNEDLGKWTCRACDRRGDALDLIQEYEHVDLAGAIEHAKGLLESGLPGVPPAAGRADGELSRRTRRRPGRRNWTPPWKMS